MTTFSQLVDDVVLELLRPDMRTTAASYANQTIRDIHFRPGNQSPIRYDANRFEELTTTTDGTWLWTIPSNGRFQGLEAIFIDDLGIYVKPRNPRIALEASFEPYADVYYYRSGPTISVHGMASGWTARLSYHMFPRTFAYKPATGTGARLIRFDPDTDSYVLISGGGVPTEEQMELETTWVLERWADTIKEGLRAKLWKRLGDMERTRMAFSAFESMRTSIWNTEPAS